MVTRKSNVPRSAFKRASGFSEPATATVPGVGASEPENGTTEPIRTPEPNERIAGFPAISPFDAPDIGSGAAESDAAGAGGFGNVAPRRRGRPPGSTNKPRSETSNTIAATLSDIKALLYSVHLMGAAILATPELELTEDEAGRLADAVKNVAKYYDIGMDPKKLAMFQFGSTALGIYGPKAITAYRRISAAPKPTRVPPTPIRMPAATDFPPPPQPDPRFTEAVNGNPPPRETNEPKPVTIFPGITNPSQMWAASPIESSGIE